MLYKASDGSKWNIYRDPPPIPTTAHDWTYYHVDYDGPGDDRHGTAASADECRANIEDWIDENPDEDDLDPKVDGEIALEVKDPVRVASEMAGDELAELIEETRERLRAVRRALVVRHQMEADLLLDWTAHVEGALTAGEDVARRLGNPSPAPGEEK